MATSIKKCKCKIKHYLRPHSTLELFLRQGLIKQSLLSPDNLYTLNHIIIAFLTILKDKALLKFDHEDDQFYVNTDKSLYSLFGFSRWFYLSDLRRLIDTRFFNNSENLSRHDSEIFICPGKDDKVIFELLNYENHNYLQMYFNYKCQKEIMDDFPYIGMGLRFKTDFDFGNYSSRPIRYSPCDCKGRYPFQKTSLLLPYLQTSLGWTSSPDNRYTINYILMVLIADFKEKNLIQFDHKGRVHAFIVNPETSIILGVTTRVFRNDSISILHIRALIANVHLEGHRHILNITQPPFSCTKSLTNQDVKLIHNLLNVPLKDPRFPAISRIPWGGVSIGHCFLLHF